MSILSCRHQNLVLQTFTRLYSFVPAIYAHAAEVRPARPVLPDFDTGNSPASTTMPGTVRLLSSSALMMAVFTPPAFAAEGAGEPAPARDPASPPSTLSANVTFTSQYVGRGIRQSWGRPALQGGVD